MSRSAGRRRARALVVAFLLVVNLAGAGVAQAAQSTSRVRISGAECDALMAATGLSAGRACVIVVEEGTGTGGPIQATASCYVPSGYTNCGSTWVRTSSILGLWSVTSTATYARNSSTGKVSWQSVTCTQSAFGYTVKITWCGSYHSGLPDTNFGANFDVSFVWEGSPITVSHGHRASINGYTGASCCTQGW